MSADLILWAEGETTSSWVWVPQVLNILIIIVALFLILLVLIQKGKGGGLAGAFGGVGGSSAFGSKAGDQFTQITLITAGIWVLLIMLMIKMIPQGKPTGDLPGVSAPPGQKEPVNPDEGGSWLKPTGDRQSETEAA